MKKLMYQLILIGYVSAFYLSGSGARAQSLPPGSVWELSLKEFTATAEKTPATILGGCVSITEGAISISVMIMALQVTKTHAKNETLIKTIDSISGILKVFQDSLKIMADRDNAIFKRFLSAYRLPAETSAQKSFKDSVIYATSLDATSSPLQAAQGMLEALELMGKSILYCSPSTKSDGLASATLLAGAIDAVLQIADPDIAALKDKDQRRFLADRNLYSERSSAILGQIKKTASIK